MQSSAGNGAGAVLPKAKKRWWSAVARAAAFRRSREQGSKTPLMPVFGIFIKNY